MTRVDVSPEQRTLRVDICPLIGSLLELDTDDWFVEAVDPDPDAVWRTHYWGDRPHITPMSWIVTIRPATLREIEDEDRVYEQIRAQHRKPSWWERWFR